MAQINISIRPFTRSRQCMFTGISLVKKQPRTSDGCLPLQVHAKERPRDAKRSYMHIYIYMYMYIVSIPVIASMVLGECTDNLDSNIPQGQRPSVNGSGFKPYASGSATFLHGWCCAR